jgi:hypothetical protein
VEGDEIARLLNASGSLEEIAASLVSAANARGGDDNISVCLARVGKVTTRLPEPEARAERLYGDVAATILPRYQAAVPREWRPDRIGLVAGLLLSLAVLAAFVYWDDFRAIRTKAQQATKVAVKARDDSSWTTAPQPVRVTPPPAAAPPPDVAVVRDSDRTVAIAAPPAPSAPAKEPPAPVAAPVKEQAKPVPAPAKEQAKPVPAPVKVPPKPVPSAAKADSIAAAEALKREAAQARLRRVNDSLVEARMALDEQSRRDSIALAVAAATRVTEQRARDSVAAAEKRKRDSVEAQERVDAQARAVAQAEENRRKQDELKATRLASGRTALNGWLTRLVAAVSSGEAHAAVMTAGPSSFVAFVEKNEPKISDAKVTSIEVDDASGEARAEWTLKWKSNFGTSTSRRVKASATVVREGEAWRMLGWKILEGEP